MIIDFHTHCFPDKIAEKAIGKLAHASGGLQPYTDGSVAGLKKNLAEQGVDGAVVLNIATNAHQQRSVNDFAASINDGVTVFSFGSVYPGSEDAFQELERIKELGLKGIKLHPDYQGFQVDDPDLRPLYRKISELGLITVFHAGEDYGFAPPYGATPDRLARALEWFDTPVVAAHMGGLHCAEGVLEHLCGKEIYFDTSFSYGQMPRYYAEKILEKHGADKILFGTDLPWHEAWMELRMLEHLGLSEEDREKVLSGNATKLLGIRG